MFDLDRIQEIWVTITRNKVRSLLTGFGVFWGIFMLVVMMGFGQGLGNGVAEEIEGIATNSCFMGSSTTSLPYKGFQKGRYWNIHNRDVKALLNSIPEIEELSPMLFSGRSENNVVYGESAGSFNVRGLNSNYAQVENQFMTAGRFINDIDINQNRKVCVIGTKVQEEIFPRGESPLGKYIRVNGIYYQVIGVALGVENMNMNGRTCESIAIPFTTIQQVNNQGDVIHMLAATAKPGKSAAFVEEKIKEVLKRLNSVSPDDQQAVWSFNMEDGFKMFDYLNLGIIILIWVVGSGTLIAGVIGVSNIMMVTVKERTREIGIRRALGAKPKTISGQIISESLVLTLISGVLGLCFGVLTLYLLDVYWLQNMENMFLKNPQVSFGIAIVSIIALTFAGLIASAIPTYRALKIKAIDAIREE
ncbi:ABC transporter permease [Bacteroidales bacterium OttesenSCG-928-I14]|nr:ABC transporter permease [Bacteroidales bacterium OttesenSCG-928-I14]